MNYMPEKKFLGSFAFNSQRIVLIYRPINDLCKKEEAPENAGASEYLTRVNYQRFPLSPCSRSIASNNALKLPLPNDFAPFL